MNRRDFLKALGLAVAAVALPAQAVQALLETAPRWTRTVEFHLGWNDWMAHYQVNDLRSKVMWEYCERFTCVKKPGAHRLAQSDKRALLSFQKAGAL